MSWHDPDRISEPMEDRTLREELCELLGVPARGFFRAELTPKMIALAEDLRREALRRRRTARQKPVWMLIAAGLPLAFALTALGAWGVAQKNRADALAKAVERQEAQLQQIAQAVWQGGKVTGKRTTLPETRAAQDSGKHRNVPGGELVIEVTPPTPLAPTQSITVNRVAE